jgi:predicted amidohydrolase
LPRTSASGNNSALGWPAPDNGLFLIFSNGVGVVDDEIRTGNAMILDPYGRILAETCKAGDDMVVAAGGCCIGIFSGDDPRMLKADVRLLEEHSSRGR